jgi:hypothetical protein
MAGRGPEPGGKIPGRQELEQAMKDAFLWGFLMGFGSSGLLIAGSLFLIWVGSRRQARR